MANHTPVTPNPKEVERAEILWAQFIHVSKISIVITSITLIILAIVFTG